MHIWLTSSNPSWPKLLESTQVDVGKHPVLKLRAHAMRRQEVHQQLAVAELRIAQELLQVCPPPRPQTQKVIKKNNAVTLLMVCFEEVLPVSSPQSLPSWR